MKVDGREPCQYSEDALKGDSKNILVIQRSGPGRKETDGKTDVQTASCAGANGNSTLRKVTWRESGLREGVLT